ncbi:MAG: STAS domain-containing protein [Lachnospiraceae bacterium]|nr:STAS domain-containing protein [Lachnospiraceae bacterium]MCR5767081.1 STAS domain-containing protein [Lachnospiraceae bacterium]
MLNITKDLNGTELSFALEGRLDTVTAPQLESEVKSSVDGVDKMVVDCAKLEYISSAGLRVLLLAQKIMNEKGSLVVRNVSEEVMEIFEVTGFVDILTIE